MAWFSGLPSPGGALLTGSGCLLLQSDALRGALVVAVALLMVSRVPYPHFGRAILPLVPKFFRVLFLATYVLMLVHAFRHHDYRWVLSAIFGASLLYLASPLFHRKPGEGAA